MVGYSTQSKGYRVYNKRTRLIVDSIHIKFDEIKEMMSDHNCSDLAPQRQEMSVERCLFRPPEKTDSSQQGLDILFSSLLEEHYNPAHGHAEDKTMIKHRMHRFKKLNLSILFVYGYNKLVSLPHSTLIIPMCIHFNHKVMITDGPEIIY
ncbi:hypothetical protein Tco_0230338 [Tanacetum coccineum]